MASNNNCYKFSIDGDTLNMPKKQKNYIRMGEETGLLESEITEIYETVEGNLIDKYDYEM